MRIGESSGMLSQLLSQSVGQTPRLEISGATLLNHSARSRELSSLWRNMNRQLLEVRDKAAVLATPRTFDAKSVSSARPDLVTATAAAEAPVGQHSVTVSQLAQAEKTGSGSYASSTTDLGLSGTFTINDRTVEVEATDDLWDLATKLNNSGAGVTATVDLTDDGQYRLEVASGQTGAANGATYVDGAAGVLGSLGVLDDTGQKAVVLAEGRDALFTLDGKEYRSESNSAGAQGLTLQLAKVAEDEVELTVADNDPAVVEAVRGLVASYNKALDDLARYQVSAGPAGSATANRFRSDLVALAQAAVPELDAERSRLAYAGLKMEAGGKLSLDEDKLLQRLAQDRDGVSKLFTAPQGVADRLQQMLNGLTQPGQSLLPESDAEAALRQFVSGQFRSITGGLSQREMALSAQAEVLNQSLALLGRTQQDALAKLSSLFGTSVD